MYDALEMPIIMILPRNPMRTTFTPDVEIAAKLKALARSSRKSMNRIINDVLRSALFEGKTESADLNARFEVQPFSLNLNPGIDLLRLNQLADVLDDEARLAAERSRGHS